MDNTGVVLIYRPYAPPDAQGTSDSVEAPKATPLTVPILTVTDSRKNTVSSHLSLVYHYFLLHRGLSLIILIY